MGIKTKSTLESLEHLSSLLDVSKKVYFNRYGDGEIFNMVNKDSREHYATEDLANELKISFSIDDPHYLKAVAINYPVEKGMIYGLFAPFKKNLILEKSLSDTFNIPESNRFENPVAFHYLSIFKPEVMNNFLNKYIRPKKKMFIGSTPKHIAEMVFGPIDVYIPIPSVGAYYKLNEWFPQIVENIDKVEVVIPSAGVASNIISSKLWQMNCEVHCLNIGSIVDAIDGLKSRKWIRLMGHRVNNIVVPEAKDRSIKFKILYLYKEIYFTLRTLVKGKKTNLPY